MGKWWKRITGASKAQSKMSRRIGIPLSRGGRRRKLINSTGGRWSPLRRRSAAGCLVMLLLVCFAAVFLLLPVVAFAQDGKPNVADLKKQIQDAEAKLADLRSRLAKAEGEPTEFKDVKFLMPGAMQVGEQGVLADKRGVAIGVHTVHKVIDDNSIVMSIHPDYPEFGRVIVKDHPTKGVADAQLIPGDRTWRVVGTQKEGGKTLFVLREVGNAKKDK